MNQKFCYFVLTCDAEQKELIARTLLEKRLIVCAKFSPIEAMYWWDGAIESAKETLIIMESREDLYDQVEAEVAKIHSYDTFVLEQVPVERVSKGAAEWMSKELKKTISNGTRY